MTGRRGQQQKYRIADDFDAFLLSYSNGNRGWEQATPDDVFDFCCFLDTQGKGTKMVHDQDCPGVGTPGETGCLPDAKCSKRYAADSMRTGVISKLKMAMREQLGKGEVWDPVRMTGNVCASPLVESYTTFVTEEQKRVGVQVNQAAPMLAHTLEDLLREMRARSQTAPSLKERISLTRDIALYSLAFASMRRGFDLSFTLGSQVLRLPDSRGFVFNFQFGKTLRAASKESVVIQPDKESPSICAVRAVDEYILAAKGVGWDLNIGHFFPEVSSNGGRGQKPLTAEKMTTSLQTHLKKAGLPLHFTMHSFRVGGSVSKSMAGTTMEEIMQIAGWKTERMARHYVGPVVSSTPPGPKRVREQAYDSSNEFTLSEEFTAQYSACAGMGKLKR